MRPTVAVTQGGSGLDKLKRDLARLAGDRVLVGIPEENNDRGEDSIGPRLKSGSFNSGEKIGNAALLFIQSNGSPLRNLPARPLIEPAIMAADNRKRIVAVLERAAQAEMAGDQAQATLELQKAGMLAVNACKRWFTDPRNNWQELSYTTIKRKLAKLKPKKRAEVDAALFDRGEDSRNYFTTLVDLGEMRRAITFIVQVAGAPAPKSPAQQLDEAEEGSMITP